MPAGMSEAKRAEAELFRQHSERALDLSLPGSDHGFHKCTQDLFVIECMRNHQDINHPPLVGKWK